MVALLTATASRNAILKCLLWERVERRATQHHLLSAELTEELWTTWGEISCCTHTGTEAVIQCGDHPLTAPSNWSQRTNGSAEENWHRSTNSPLFSLLMDSALFFSFTFLPGDTLPPTLFITLWAATPSLSLIAAKQEELEMESCRKGSEREKRPFIKPATNWDRTKIMGSDTLMKTCYVLPLLPSCPSATRRRRRCKKENKRRRKMRRGCGQRLKFNFFWWKRSMREDLILNHILCFNVFSVTCQKWELNRVMGRDVVLLHYYTIMFDAPNTCNRLVSALRFRATSLCKKWNCQIKWSRNGARLEVRLFLSVGDHEENKSGFKSCTDWAAPSS